MGNGKVIKVSGPLVVAEGLADANMFDVVRVGRDRLIGEIIEMRGDQASIQVYEETAGLGPGDEVATTGAPLSVELGPGLITTIYDGIQRPLEAIRDLVEDGRNEGIQLGVQLAKQILNMAKENVSIPEIARRLSISEKEVRQLLD